MSWSLGEFCGYLLKSNDLEKKWTLYQKQMIQTGYQGSEPDEQDTTP